MSTSWLSSINAPEDISSLSLVQLQQLAAEIRHRIIDVLSVNGGHLGSNLGIVELTLALHFVFRSPEDKFIFDVSHQTYIHKLLTGRQDKFAQIRKYKGLCGFSHPKESSHDHFFAGHAGTALSLALGTCKARDLTGSQEHVIPILGDASLTCGLTLEALNNVPKELQKMIVILNDNKMSISQNVGAITNILSRFLSNPTSNKIFHEIESFLAKIPNLGGFLAKQGQKLAESLKNLVSTAPFFEQFGLSYVGPIDGHDIGKLIDTLIALKNNPKPILLHVITTKGKGMATAISNPTPYHGCRPFDKETGIFHAPSNKPTFPQIFGKQILSLAQRDSSIVAVTPAMPAGSCLEAFMQKFPDRCLDVGIAEGHAVTFCGALAKNKDLKVVCSIYSTFLQRALDNVFHDVCLQEAPVVFAVDRGGISGPDGSTHHGIYEMSFLQAMPHMVICQPRNGQLLKELLESSFSWNLPTAIRYPNLPTEEGSSALQKRSLGKGEVLIEGEKLLLIGLGHMSLIMLQVQEKLKSYNIEATVVDPIFVKPIDAELFSALLLTHTHVVTLEEHSLQGGFASAFQSFLSQNPAPSLSLLHLGIPDRFVEQGSHAELLLELGLTPDDICATIVKQCNPLIQPMLAGHV
ncbi:MAG: 1-deoxy-D-xylulose-5-phosphate synthase [Rhabdochlamydiaceae bacterium]|nr:1-deoxy-D-xylulose-5-phosphate synthase [Rhabdochlamydiaceae bacterium]